jgi:hypothetical protein
VRFRYVERASLFSGEDVMPDFEIRYFHADGSLAMVRVTSRPTKAEAEACARQDQEHYTHFEVREVGALAPQ